MIQLENLKLDYIDYDNIEHLKFLKKMMIIQLLFKEEIDKVKANVLLRRIKI